MERTVAVGHQGSSGHLDDDAATAGDRDLGRLDLALLAAGGALLVALTAWVWPPLAVAGLAGSVFLVFCLQRPRLIGYTLVAVVPVTSGLAHGLPIPGVRLPEALIVAAAIVVLPRGIGQRDRKWRTLDWAALGFVTCHVLVSGFSGAMHGALGDGGISKLVGPVQFFLLYRTVSATILTAAQRRIAMRILLFMVIPVSLLALAQFAQVPGVQNAVTQVTETEIFESWSFEISQRATGPFAAWHPLAGYLFLPAVVAVALLLQERATVMSRKSTIVVIGFAASAMLVSQTLNALAGVVLASIVVAVVSGRALRFAGPLVLVGIVIALLFAPVISRRLDSQDVSSPLDRGSALELPQTIQYRVNVWEEQYFPAIRRDWMTGYGPNIPPEITWRSTESLYFTLLLRGGVVLLGSYIVFMVVAVRDALARRGARIDVAQRAAALAIIGGVIALIPMHAVFPYFTASGLPQVFWMLLAFMPNLEPRSERTTSSAQVQVSSDDA